MTQAKIALLRDRGVVSLTGPDAAKFLQGLVTNDVEALQADAANTGHAARAVHAGLLSPQGKILFEFFCVLTPEGFMLEVARDSAGDLVKRLSMYKLRAKVEIADQSRTFDVLAEWGAPNPAPLTSGSFEFADPRLAALGRRTLLRRPLPLQGAGHNLIERRQPWDDYHAHRIALGVPEGGKDFDFGDAYPHEADFDLFNGVSFTKGCYVGQEIVARMQHKTVVRKRVVPVTGDRDLPSDRPDIVAGEVQIGRLGSVSGSRGLALLRLDRAAEATAQNVTLTSAGITLHVEPMTVET